VLARYSLGVDTICIPGIIYVRPPFKQLKGLRRDQSTQEVSRSGNSSKLIATIYIASLLVFWRWLWGYCWNPLETSCFSAPNTSGDHIQHYYAWQAYATGNLASWLPPKFSNWTWPEQVPLIYGDTVPLASVILAPIAKITKISFQFFSTLSLVSIIGSYLCGAWIGNYFSLKPSQSSLIGLIIAISPPALIRVAGHEALSLHVVIILAIALMIRRIRSLAAWSLILLLSLGTHAYMFAISFPMAILAQFTCKYEGNEESVRLANARSCSLRIGLLCIVAVSCLGLLGYIPNSTDINSDGDIWSANVFSLLDPQGNSFIAKSLDKKDPHQWEGFSYLGWLGITAIAISIGATTATGRTPVNNSNIFPSPRWYWSLITLFAIFSLGDQWFAGKTLIMTIGNDLTLVRNLQKVFHATGRFMWPAYYSLLLWGLINSMRSTKFPKSLAIFFAILLLETHIPTAIKVKEILASHYRDGQEWQQKRSISQDPLLNTLTHAQLLLNATGDPGFRTDSLPQFIPKAMNPQIATNYAPYLARLPKNFEASNTGEPCKLAEGMIRNAANSFERDKIYVIMKAKDADKCQHLIDQSSQQVVIGKVPTAIYSLTPQQTD